MEQWSFDLEWELEMGPHIVIGGLVAHHIVAEEELHMEKVGQGLAIHIVVEEELRMEKVGQEPAIHTVVVVVEGGIVVAVEGGIGFELEAGHIETVDPGQASRNILLMLPEEGAHRNFVGEGRIVDRRKLGSRTL